MPPTSPCPFQRGVPSGMQLAGPLEEAGRRRPGRRTQRAASQASQEMKLLRATMREPLFELFA